VIRERERASVISNLFMPNLVMPVFSMICGVSIEESLNKYGPIVLYYEDPQP
jgi:hypothetical protein